MDDIPSSPTEEFQAEISYYSPTLARLQPDRRPNPTTICETCPAAIWHTLPHDTRAFCKVMHLLVYSKKEPLELTACDGREMAMADLVTC